MERRNCFISIKIWVKALTCKNKTLALFGSQTPHRDVSIVSCHNRIFIILCWRLKVNIEYFGLYWNSVVGQGFDGNAAMSVVKERCPKNMMRKYLSVKCMHCVA